MSNTYVTPEQADAAAETLAKFIEQESAPSLLSEAIQDDGSLYKDGKSVFWIAGTEDIEISGTFTLQELLEIVDCVQDFNDAEQPSCPCEQ